MKNQILNFSILLILVSFLMMSCSTDKETSDIDDKPLIEIKQYIKKIEHQNPKDYQKGAQFFYKNGKLTYIYLDDCSGQLLYYEYNNDGRISRGYEGSTNLTGDNFNPETFDLESYKQNIHTNYFDYVYSNKKLVKMQHNRGFSDYNFIYNADNKVESIECVIQNSDLTEKLIFKYVEGKISSISKKRFYPSNSSEGLVTYTFEYDENPNPLNLLAQSYGLINLNTCTGLDVLQADDMGNNLFQNNVTKVYEDGKLLYSASYQYDENKYPTRINYTKINGQSGVELITYDK
ncbi:hypothetical protein ES711_08590 [Gelidibacter salicanalis]|uniref:DUF4595 domain-containing protein n=1 Tax=Gelidibacter salicanalis TaxID=291193 RepID=A0A5C7AIG0_9FLAO|nr:hypothetical protein [Gelidibacter salicanalis]TXE08550.1 hypothetical protein ES711_08590 [Gelidibacter salicanalis]